MPTQGSSPARNSQPASTIEKHDHRADRKVDAAGRSAGSSCRRRRCPRWRRPSSSPACSPRSGSSGEAKLITTKSSENDERPARPRASRTRRASDAPPRRGVARSARDWRCCPSMRHGAPACACVARSAKEASRMMFSSVIASPATSPVIRPSRTTSTRSQRPISSGSSEEMTTMPTPSRRELAQDAVDLGLGADVDAARRLVEEDAPAGRTDSILAIATFCWLPPDSVETGSSMPPRLRPSRSPSAVACAVLRLARRSCPRRETCSRSSAEMFAAIGRSRKHAVALAVLGEVDDAVVDAVAVGADRQRLAVERDLAGRARPQPADALERSRCGRRRSGRRCRGSRRAAARSSTSRNAAAVAEIRGPRAARRGASARRASSGRAGR